MRQVGGYPNYSKATQGVPAPPGKFEKLNSQESVFLDSGREILVLSLVLIYKILLEFNSARQRNRS